MRGKTQIISTTLAKEISTRYTRFFLAVTIVLLATAPPAPLAIDVALGAAATPTLTPPVLVEAAAPPTP